MRPALGGCRGWWQRLLKVGVADETVEAGDLFAVAEDDEGGDAHDLGAGDEGLLGVDVHAVAVEGAGVGGGETFEAGFERSAGGAAGLARSREAPGRGGW